MEQLKLKLIEFQNIVKKIQEFMETAPTEKLRIRTKGIHYQYYTEKNKKRSYITKKNIGIAKKIAQRDYYQKLLPHLTKNINTMNHFISNYNSARLDLCYSKLTQARKQLVNPIFLDNETYAQQWQAQEYEHKNELPDGKYETLKKEFVRSKSEIIIADLLKSKKVPYHYEYPVHLSNGIIIHPDFFCLNKRTRQEFYWEHFGKMDDPEYAVKMVQRISAYSKKGIIPGKNLLITLETNRTPLETKSVNQLIENYLI